MILDILEILLRGLHIPHVYLIQITIDQNSIPIQGPSYSSEYTEKPFLFSKLIYNNSNFLSFANVPTPPSVHHYVYVC